MDIAHLKTFCHLYRTGSFSEAAKLIFRSQPAVSLQIKELEEELGTKLFERFGPMKVKPTKDAESLYKTCSPLIKGFESIPKTLEALKSPQGAVEINIATHEAVVTYLLPDYIEGFAKKYPKARFSILRESKENIIKRVLDGDTDLGITSLEKAPNGIIYKKFANHKRLLICQKRHPLTKLKTVTPKDIVQYPLILPPLHSETRNVLDNVFKKRGLFYTMFLELAAREAVKIYVERGFGVSILNDYYLFPEDYKKLDTIDVSKDFGSTERGLLYRKGKKFSPLQQEFIDSILKNQPAHK